MIHPSSGVSPLPQRQGGLRSMLRLCRRPSSGAGTKRGLKFLSTKDWNFFIVESHK